MYSLGDSKITYLRKSVFSLAFGFLNIAFIIPSHFIYCAIFYSLDVGFFQYHPGVKQFGSRSGPTF